MITCKHRDRVRGVRPLSDGCEDCLRAGDRWVRLRMCLTCGHVGCCDSSRGRHATGHFEATGHPLMRSAEPGEVWAWCYVDREGFETADVSLEDPPAAESGELESARPFVDALYREFLARGIEYFFPQARLEMLGPAAGNASPDVRARADTGDLEFGSFGFHFRVSAERHVFSTDEIRLLDSIRRVLSARYHLLFDAALAAQRLQLFHGLPEDRYVSAFLDPTPYASIAAPSPPRDRVADAIQVLRLSALTTYENRRIETGVLLFGALPEDCHPPPPSPPAALPYSAALAEIRSFHRLCDGVQTLALVDRSGLLVELVDVQEWAAAYDGLPLPVPTIERYAAHSRATLCGGHVCLVLTPNGEIKIFADGRQVFSFLDGRWRLSDAREKYAVWRRAIGNEQAAERLFTVALTLAEDRRGALFVVLDDPSIAEQIIPAGDLLTDPAPAATSGGKQGLHYLLRDTNLFRLTPAVLESIARIDGAIVSDASGRLLAFGTILRPPAGVEPAAVATEGGRTTAALSASRFGKVLMVSEDGRVSFFQGGRRAWQL